MAFELEDLQRGAIQNLDSGEFITFMMNPSELTTAISVSYARKAPIASSRQRLQYRGTANAQFSMTMVFDRMVYFRRQRSGSGVVLSDMEIQRLIKDYNSHRKFLMGLAYPAGEAHDPLRRAPPAAMLIWPGILAVKVVLVSLQFQDVRFDSALRPVTTNAQVRFEEYRSYRLTSADAVRDGFEQRRTS